MPVITQPERQNWKQNIHSCNKCIFKIQHSLKGNALWAECIRSVCQTHPLGPRSTEITRRHGETHLPIRPTIQVPFVFHTLGLIFTQVKPHRGRGKETTLQAFLRHRKRSPRVPWSPVPGSPTCLKTPQRRSRVLPFFEPSGVTRVHSSAERGNGPPRSKREAARLGSGPGLGPPTLGPSAPHPQPPLASPLAAERGAEGGGERGERRDMERERDTCGGRERAGNRWGLTDDEWDGR